MATNSHSAQVNQQNGKSQPSMSQQLPEILSPHAELLDEIAQVWLDSGAAHVAIWGEGKVYANWANKPKAVSSSQPTYTQISASIRVGEDVFGHLYVFGQNDRISKKRLKLDANLISSKITIDIGNLVSKDSARELAESEAVADMVRTYQVLAEKSEQSLVQVQKQFDALVRLNQYEQPQVDETLETWLSFFKKTVLDLIPSQHVFTIDNQEQEDLVLECHPVRFKDAEEIVNYLQDMESIGHDLHLDSASELAGIPESVKNLLYTVIYTSENRSISLGLVNRNMGSFSAGDQSLIKTISLQAQNQIDRLLNQAEILENNRIKTEMEVAYEVQNHFLPEPPPFIQGLDIFATSRPAKHVGGDFYDFQVRENSTLVFTVGDVSGKGMPSALMMGNTRQILNSKARDGSIKSPRDLLTNGLRDLYEEFSRVQMFATVFAAFYNPDTQQLTYANAGHSPVIFCSAAGEIQMLEADSPPLGVLSTSLALNHTLQLFPGDCLIVATDGLSETQDIEENQYGNERLLELVQATCQDGAAHVAKSILKELEVFSIGSQQTDDQTLVVFKVE